MEGKEYLNITAIFRLLTFIYHCIDNAFYNNFFFSMLIRLTEARQIHIGLFYIKLILHI